MKSHSLSGVIETTEPGFETAGPKHFLLQLDPELGGILICCILSKREIMFIWVFTKPLL